MLLRKITNLRNGTVLAAHWANNRGRGRDNCTLSILPAAVDRGVYVRDNKHVIASCRTSSWQGSVNLSRNVLAKLGIKLSDLLLP